MSGRQLPAVTGKQIVKALAAEDWYVKRIRGSHYILRHPSITDAIPVPVHCNRPLKPGTLGNILLTAGLSRNELAKLLYKPRPARGAKPSTVVLRP